MKVKNVFLLLIAAILSGAAILSCGDGKLNILIVSRVDREEDELEEIPKEDPSSSSLIKLSSTVAPSSSSSEEPLILISSSSLMPVYQYSHGIPLEKIETLEDGDPNVLKGWASRYWDGCKPSCSWPTNIGNPNPWAICRNCDRLNKEMPAYFMDPRTSPDDPWNPPRYFATQSGCESPENDIYQYWGNSVTYQNWLLKNPAFPGVGPHPNYPNQQNGGAHTCFDMIPIAINDTLAYAFGATPGGSNTCGKCYQIQFDGGWEPNPNPRVTHSALKGKTLIIMASNVGNDVGSGQFDIMIPGGGTGAFDGFSWQIDKVLPVIDGNPFVDQGFPNGGLLTSCFWGANSELRDGGWNASLEEWQTCLRKRCRSVFGNVPNDPEGNLLKGCLWHADWFMAADNPTLLYKEVQCPQYLKNKYGSTIDVAPPSDGCFGGVDC